MRIGSWITTRLSLATAALTLFAGVSLASAQTSAPSSLAVQTHSVPRITAAIDPTQRKTLGNSISPLASGGSDLGRADASLPMKDMLLLLQPTEAQAAALKQVVADLHNPNSPNFHKWMTPAEYAAQFGLDDADIKTVITWLSSNGFTIEKVAQGKNWIRFSGTSSQVEATFQTSMHAYSVNGQTRYANAKALSIPAALATAVTGVVRANNFLSKAEHVTPTTIARGKDGKLVRANVAGTTQASSAKASSAPDVTFPGDQAQTYLTPGDFATIYDSKAAIAAGNDGTGITIAIVGRSDIETSDIEAFRTLFGLPFNDPTITYATTDPGDVYEDDVEASLDVEWSGAVAPKANINYVIGASTSSADGVDLASSYIVDNKLAPIMSVSFGICEALMSDTQVAFYQLLWQQAALEGISVFVAAGDSGASACNDASNASTVYGFGVSGLASTPYNTAVGGTEFNNEDLSTYWSSTNAPDQSSAKGYIPEAVWNEGCTANVPYGLSNCNFPPYSIESAATGGGASSCISRTVDDTDTEYCAAGYPKPSWQSVTGVPADGVRDIPDVSLAAAAAHDGFIFCIQGGCQWTTNTDGSLSIQNANLIGGTSAASPSMAGIMALVEQKHGAFQGLANYELYNLAAQTGASCDASKRTDPTQPSTCVFNDITAGSNATACFSGNQDCQGQDQPVQVGATQFTATFPPDSQMDGYTAIAGYDPASGLGSVDIANLVTSWTNIAGASSTTSLTLSQTTFTHGTAITLTGTVAPASGSSVPTGDVLITTADGTAVATATLVSGAYSVVSINLPGGTYALTAKYSGSSTFATSTSQPVTVTVAPEAATLTGTTFAYASFLRFGVLPLLNRTANAIGLPFWVQFQVSGTSGSIAATGNINLTMNGKAVGTYPINNAGLIYIQCGPGTPCDPAVGSYNFTASYAGDSSFNASTGTAPFTVTTGNIFTGTFVSNPEPVAGTPVVLKAEFAYQFFAMDPAFPPTGQVTFSRDDTGATLGTATIDSTGVATLQYIPPPAFFNVLATFTGDSNYHFAGQVESSGIDTLVNSGTNAAKVVLNLGGATFNVGQKSQVSVVVTSATTASKATPIGVILVFNEFGEIGGQLLLAGGKASGTVEWDTPGVQHVYAVYGGDGNFGSTYSTPTAITVSKIAPSLALQPVSTVVAVGSQASITALLGNPNGSTGVPTPSGSIQFFDSLAGATAVAIGTPQGITSGNQGTILATVAQVLAQGSHVITAVYSGDTYWAAITSASPAIVVTTPGFTDAPAASSLAITAGETASVSINTQSVLGFSGEIALSCGGTLPEGVTCASANVAPGAAGTIALTSVAPGVTSTTASAAKRNPLLSTSGAVAFAGLLLICIPNRRRLQNLAVVFIALGFLGGVVGCGGGGGVNATTMLLSSSNTKVASGSTVTLEAAVESRSNAQGTVTFYDGSAALGSAVPVTNGVATLTSTTLAVGTHPITAKYSGDNDDAGSASSNIIEQTVTGAFTLTINATSGSLSQPVTLPATLQ